MHQKLCLWKTVYECACLLVACVYVKWSYGVCLYLKQALKYAKETKRNSDVSKVMIWGVSGIEWRQPSTATRCAIDMLNHACSIFIGNTLLYIRVYKLQSNRPLSTMSHKCWVHVSATSLVENVQVAQRAIHISMWNSVSTVYGGATDHYIYLLLLYEFWHVRVFWVSACVCLYMKHKVKKRISACVGD